MHPRLRLFAPVLLGAALLSAAPAHAGVPSPIYSEIPDQLLLCPYEGIPFVIVVRDAGGNPVASSTVQINLNNCIPDIYYPTLIPTNPCPEAGSSHVLAGSDAVAGGLFTLVSDVNGRVEFRIQAGGVCANGAARILADGVLLAFRSVASPDQDGNLVVLGQDAAVLVAKQTSGSFDATADLDGDGDTNNDTGDYAVYDLHAGHGCDAITPSARRSWGSVKILYR